MLIYNKYINERDYSWYDSSNILFSECIDTTQEEKTLKIVFKNGRKYLYKNVNVKDYLLFKNAESNGSAFNKHIRKYETVRMPDVDLKEIDDLKESMEKVDNKLEETNPNTIYHIEYNPETKEFELSLNNEIIFSGIDDKVNIFRLFKSMNIMYSFNTKEQGEKNENQ